MPPNAGSVGHSWGGGNARFSGRWRRHGHQHNLRSDSLSDVDHLRFSDTLRQPDQSLKDLNGSRMSRRVTCPDLHFDRDRVASLKLSNHRF